MTKITLLGVSLGLGLSASAAFAGSSFQNTCSNIEFAYVHNAATLKAMCLRHNGTANATSLTINGIGNNNGRLVRSGGPSTFQQSCGNIQITANDTRNVSLSAFCRTISGDSYKTRIPLDGISNNNGNLTY